MTDEKALTLFENQNLLDQSVVSYAERIAIALEYDGNRAPFITATGENQLADEIIEIAKAHEIPIMENSELAGLLAKLEMGDEIPELLYLTIAQIIAFVYMLKDKIPTPPKNAQEH